MSKEIIEFVWSSILVSNMITILITLLLVHFDLNYKIVRKDKNK